MGWAGEGGGVGVTFPPGGSPVLLQQPINKWTSVFWFKHSVCVCVDPLTRLRHQGASWVKRTIFSRQEGLILKNMNIFNELL